MKTIKKLNISWQAESERYWRGHGLAFSNHTDCATGCGSTLREALGYALESLAQQDIAVSNEQEAEMLAELGPDANTDIRFEYCDFRGEPHYYVSVEVTTEDSQ